MKGVIYSVNKRTHTINTRRLMEISTIQHRQKFKLCS